MREFIDQLKAPDFIGKVLLLLITAALTGILVPEIAAQLSEDRFRDQKIFEAELQRQQEILSSQNALLGMLSERLWEFQLLNIDVSFYKVSANETAYAKAAEAYQSKAATLLGQIRADMSKSKRLVSPLMQKKLASLYFETLLPIDGSLEMLIKEGSSTGTDEWREQHNRSFGMAQNQIDGFLTELAIELQLAASGSLAGQWARNFIQDLEGAFGLANAAMAEGTGSSVLSLVKSSRHLSWRW